MLTATHSQELLGKSASWNGCYECSNILQTLWITVLCLGTFLSSAESVSTGANSMFTELVSPLLPTSP